MVYSSFFLEPTRNSNILDLVLCNNESIITVKPWNHWLSQIIAVYTLKSLAVNQNKLINLIVTIFLQVIMKV